MKITTSTILILFCFTLASQERENILSLNDDELIVLEQKLESLDPTFRFEFVAEKDVSFFLAAQKRRPQSFIWIWGIQMHFSGERYNARQLENEDERKTLFENALLYLTESLNTLENVTLTDVNDTIQYEYNLMLGMLKENIAFAAVGAGELDMAKEMAKELLINNGDTMSFNYGSTIHNTNTIIGRVALRENDLQKAKEYLVKSADTPGGPALNSFGPSYILAKELLIEGEKEVVLEYLDLIAKFWILPSDRTRLSKIDLLEKWSEEIESGKIPDNPQWK